MKHCFREVNKFANALAKRARIQVKITFINSFIAFHKNYIEVLTVIMVCLISKSGRQIERYHTIKFARSACILFGWNLWRVFGQYHTGTLWEVFFLFVAQILSRACEGCIIYWRFSTSSITFKKKFILYLLIFINHFFVLNC